MTVGSFLLASALAMLVDTVAAADPETGPDMVCIEAAAVESGSARRALAACKARFGWSKARLRHARTIADSLRKVAEARRELLAGGFDEARLRRILDRLTVADRVVIGTAKGFFSPAGRTILQRVSTLMDEDGIAPPFSTPAAQYLIQSAIADGGRMAFAAEPS